MNVPRHVAVALTLFVLLAPTQGQATPDNEQNNQVLTQPEAPPITPSRVLVQLFGPIESLREIPGNVGSVRTEWEQGEFGFTRLPHRYDDWGIRADWGHTLLVRAWAKVTLPAGEYQLLARSRGLSRLWVDGELLATTPPQKAYGSAHHKVLPLPPVPIADMRPAAMYDREKFADITSEGGTHTVLFEVIVGGPNYRAEFGETCVAIARDGEMFHLLSPASDENWHVPLTDDGWNAFVERQEAALDKLDTVARRAANQNLADYWQQRHDFARDTIIASSDPTSIDAVILQRIREHNAKAADSAELTKGDRFFFDHVQPILATHCYRCHGEKQKGGLNLTDRENALAGGDSELPAVVPHEPVESILVELVTAPPGESRMPPKGEGLSAKQVETLTRWIEMGAPMPTAPAEHVQPTPIVDDLVFLRRLCIDTIGVAPNLEMARQFLADDRSAKRSRWIDQLLADPRWADNWVGYWQDVLAENPNLLKPTLNNTGPFRWWIYEALLDNKPLDRFATELMLMRGSKWNGGTAGFAVASQNDVPMAAKAHVIGSAFLGVQLKCARCHDAPYHDWKQSDVFELAAMLSRKPIKLPSSSTVPAAFFEEKARESLIEVSLTPGSTVHPEFPFAPLAHDFPDELLIKPQDTRHRLAAQVTTSRRFAEVLANRVWARLMGAGIVEPVDDWQGNPPSDPQLLALLADELIASGYDIKHLTRIIFNSDAYQRQAVDAVQDNSRPRWFAGPYRRRMTAEQIVDNAHHAVGKPMNTEILTLDEEGDRPPHQFINFGRPQRAWEFTTMANERDRPSLALPRAQAIADVLKAFGWRNSRPQPTSQREEAPNLIQPGVLANGVLGSHMTRLTDDSAITALARKDQSVEQIVDDLFMQVLTRQPTAAEREQYVALLSPGFENRLLPPDKWREPPPPKRYRYVSWSNHFDSDANVIKMEMEKLVRKGPPPTKYLRSEWRELAEDAVWAMFNSPEMVLVP